MVDLSKSINLSNSGCLTVGGSAAGEEDGAEDEDLLERRVDDESSEVPPPRFHLQTLMIYKLGFNQNYHTLTLILLIKIFVCGKCP